MNSKKIQSIIESLLFIWGEPLGLKDISNILGLNEIESEKILNNMMEEFDQEERGLKIVRTKNNYQLCTRPEHDEWVSKLSIQNKTKNLSNASLETLSIIAYKQPITRNEMEEIRGVRCNKAIQTLVDRGLVEERGRLEKLGRPIIYGTTMEFLRYFGLEDLKYLPPIKDLGIESHQSNELEK